MLLVLGIMQILYLLSLCVAIVYILLDSFFFESISTAIISDLFPVVRGDFTNHGFPCV